MEETNYMKFCSKCGYQLKDDDLFCPSCGSKVEPLDNKIHVSADLRNIASSTGDNVSNKSRLCAALLAFFLGGLGIHRFYMGKTTSGIFMLLFCWTLIPSIIAFVDFIIILCGSATDSEGKQIVEW